MTDPILAKEWPCHGAVEPIFSFLNTGYEGRAKEMPVVPPHLS